MIAEAIERVLKLQDKAATPHLVHVDWNERILFVNGQEVDRFPYVPEPRKYVLCSLDAVIRAAQTWSSGRSVIFHNHNTIEVVLDEAERAEIVTMVMLRSEAWLALERISHKMMFQAEWLRYLEAELAGCVVTPPNFELLIRTLHFAKHSRMVSEAGHSASSLGKEVAAEVKSGEGDEPIPRQITVKLPMYAHMELSTPVDIPCRLSVDEEGGRLAASIVPDSVTHAIEGMQQVVADTLKQKAEAAGIAESTVIINGSANLN